jgi:hypothetical protein
MRRNLIGRKLLVASIGVASVSYACGNSNFIVGNCCPGAPEVDAAGEGVDAAGPTLDAGGLIDLGSDSGTDASDAEPPDAANTDAAPAEAGDAGQADAEADAPADAAEEG